VTLKYIVKEENYTDADLLPFMERAVALKPKGMIVDFDYDYPDPGKRIIRAMGRLKSLARAAGIPARYGFTGANFAPEYGIAGRAETAFRDQQSKRGRPGLPAVSGPFPTRMGQLLRSARRTARWCRGRPAMPDVVTWLEHDLPSVWHEGGLYTATVKLRNDGLRTWKATHPEGKAVSLLVHLDGKAKLTIPLPHDVAPGQEAKVQFEMQFPVDGNMGWSVKLALIEQGVAWLEHTGAVPLVVPVGRLPAWTPTDAQESPDAAAQAGEDEPSSIPRRIWHLPVKTGSGNACH
jgi:hypothetical protein